MLFVDLLARWAHVGAALSSAMGETILPLRPDAGGEGTFRPISMTPWRARIERRGAASYRSGSCFLLLSGFYNFFSEVDPAATKGRALSRPDGDQDPLHRLLQWSSSLASVLTGRSPKLRSRGGSSHARWLTILILLSAVTAGIGSFLKVRGGKPAGQSFQHGRPG